MVSQECSEFDVAVIGMAGRFPKAKNIQQYWDNLCRGVNSTHFASKEELQSTIEDQQHTENFVNASIPLEGIDQFDAEFFQMSPADAVLMDPQIRLLLQTSWLTLEDGGYDSFNYAGSIGNFCSMGTGDYLQLLIEHDPILANQNTLQTRILNEKDFLATQISYKLNLKGPAMTVQTACSSSLLAVHLACQSLISEECDMALAGGSQIDATQSLGYFYTPGSIMSPDGYCRAFDKQAQGTVQGNGVGMVLLKKLSNALRDGDRVYAVIKGTAANNDGADKMAYTAPSVDSQRDVILEALSVSDIDASTVGLIEAHGTGTPIGDPVEMTALTEAYRQFTDATQYCAIGSVKTNIGHLDAASGIASMIKAVLCVYHGQLAPSINYSEPNPALQIEQSPFYVCDQQRAWQTEGHPRRAGISSFGVGGTNVHALIEQPPTGAATSYEQPCYLVPLSAKSEKALEEQKRQLREALQDDSDLSLADVQYTLLHGRRSFEHKFSVICESKVQLLRQLTEEQGTNSVSNTRSPLVFMFPGQGSQYANMALELYQHNTVFKNSLDSCCFLADQYISGSLKDYLYADKTDQLSQTDITQLAVFAIEYSLSQLWLSYGVSPDIVVGHSLGEFTAACLAQVISLEDAVKLIYHRSRLMSTMPTGQMISVNAPLTQIEQLLCSGVVVAAQNSPRHIVLAAEEQQMAQQVQILSSQAVSYKLLKTSHAFHSPMMMPMLEDFKKHLDSVVFSEPSLPFYSTLTGQLIDGKTLCDSQYWLDQIVNPVLFSQSIAAISGDLDKPFYLEVGPGGALTSFCKAITSQVQRAVSSLPKTDALYGDVEGILSALEKLWHAGVRLRKPQHTDEKIGGIVSLPGTAFQTRSFWVRRSKKTGLSNFVQHDSLQDIMALGALQDNQVQSLKVGVELSFDESEHDKSAIIEVLEQAQNAFAETINALMPSSKVKLDILVESHSMAVQSFADQVEDKLDSTITLTDRETKSDYVAPKTNTEKRLVQLWQAVLGYQPASMNDDFFSVGGDSLTATTLLAKVTKEFDVALSFEDVAQAQTVDELAKLIDLKLWLKNDTSDDDELVSADEADEVFEI